MGSLMEARRRILLSSPHKETIQSADIAQFSTDMRSPLRALSLSIDPVQDLHGYDSPWPGGGGKNKLVPVVPGGSITWNDVTLSAQNGELYLNGKPTTSGGRTSLRTSSFTLPAGTYIISCITTQFVLHDTSDNIIANTLGTASFTLAEDTSVYAGFNVIANTQYSGVLKAQIESGSTATTYAPYSNLCPISGWAEAQVWRTGRNLCSTQPTLKTTTVQNLFDAGRDMTGNYSLRFTLDNVTFQYSSSALFNFKRDDGTNYYLTPGKFKRVSDGQTMHTITQPISGDFVMSEPLNVPFRYLNCYFMSDSYGRYTGTMSNLQLELGTTPTPYTPYTGTTIPVTWSEAGTVYGGVWDVVNGVLRVDRAYALLNDPDKWGAVSSVTQDFEYTQLFNDRKLYSTSFQGLICSAFAVNISAAVYMRWTSSTSKKIGIKNNTSAYTLSDIQQMAQDNQIAIVYELATPLEYTLTPQQLDTLAGQQNVVWGDSGEIELLKYWTHK